MISDHHIVFLRQACLKPVLNFLAALKAKDALRVVALRGMVDVWKVEERCFGELEAMLLLDDGSEVEWTLAKALAIREICTTK